MTSTLAMISSNRIDQRFRGLRQSSAKALVCYATAGYPSRSKCLELLRGLEDEGADIVEIGVPFSDPIADGPIIQESSQRALAEGMNLDRTLELISRASLGIPVVLFTYLNPLLASGDDVLERAAGAGIDGILVTDLPLGADPERECRLAESELAFIRLVAPTTPVERMEEIARTGSGFVYLISRLGVTGIQGELSAGLDSTVRRLRSVTELPVCVGFGVSSPEQATAIGEIADGVVVGSALMRAAGESVEDALRLARALRSALNAEAANG